MIRKYFYLIPICSLLFSPIAALALEQGFTQNDLKATVKLTPDVLYIESKVNLTLKLEKSGQPVTDKKVTLEVFEKDQTEPMLRREVNVLENEYVDSWIIDKPGEYKVVATVANPEKPSEVLRYEVSATAGEAKHSEHEHGFFSHHFGDGKWGWWGGGMMLLMMVPMLIIAL